MSYFKGRCALTVLNLRFLWENNLYYHNLSFDYLNKISPLQPKLPTKAHQKYQAGQLYGSAQGLLLASAALQYDGPILVLTDSAALAHRLEQEARFYLANHPLPILHFPDWETLPYDTFSPHQDIIAERLATLQQLPSIERGILLVSVTTIMHRLPPPEFLASHTLTLHTGDHFNIEAWCQQLANAGYRRTSQVNEYGEFAVRGAIIDIYPMGSQHPYRIDLFDDEIDTMRTFDPDTQRSTDTVNTVQVLPACECPITTDSIQLFRRQFREHIAGDPQRSLIYREVSAGNAPNGIEYYLPLFFKQTSNLIDYLPAHTLILSSHHLAQTVAGFLARNFNAIPTISR